MPKQVATAPAVDGHALSFLECAAMMGLTPDMVVYPVESEDYSPEQEAIAADLMSYMEGCGSGESLMCDCTAILVTSDVISAAPTGFQLSWFKLKELSALKKPADKALLRQIHELFPASKKSGELYLMEGV